jgi:hypothetical protein
VVSYVLRRMEDPECQSSQKVPRTKKSCHWPKGESCGVLQEIRNVLQLRNVVSSVATVLNEQGENVVMLFASVGWIQFRYLVENLPPSFSFLWSIINPWDGCPTKKY